MRQYDRRQGRIQDLSKGGPNLFGQFLSTSRSRVVPVKVQAGGDAGFLPAVVVSYKLLSP